MASSFFHVHAHSQYSWLDGMGTVDEMVSLAAQDGQPALALTDHGVMSGAIQLYQSCRQHGIMPFPGIELYVCDTLDGAEPRYHLGMLALDHIGYKAMVDLTTMSHRPDGHFYRKPRVSLPELYDFGRMRGKHVAVLTGCYFSRLVQTLINQGENPAYVKLLQLARVFRNLYVEIQMHNVVHPDGSTDWDIATQLYRLAQRTGLPVLVTQDSHYCRQGDKVAHEMMKRLGYHTSDDNEVLFPGRAYHVASQAYMARMALGVREAWQEAQNGFQQLLGQSQLTLPALDQYHFAVPKQDTAPNRRLRQRAFKGLELIGYDVDREYISRLEYELGIIKQMGFADYFLLVLKVVEYARAKGILINARGSVNGSLVCFCLGISQIDPIVWEISFDRFLHPSRKKPPDIDMDVDRDRRHEIVRFMERSFTVTQIGTFLRMIETENRGSVFVKYLSYKRRVLGDQFKGSDFDNIRSLWDLEEIAPEDAVVLRRLAQYEVYSGPGTHAAGFVLTDKHHPLGDYVPTMLVGGQKGNTVTQMTMNDVEAAGYVKLDLLGMAALTTVGRCLTMIGRNPVDGFAWVPMNDTGALKELSSGRVSTGVFQWEGFSTAYGSRGMRITSNEDAVLALALFRPAAMKSGHTDEFLRLRKSKMKVSYIHSSFQRHTQDTFGVFIFQDQVIDVLRTLGMSYEDVNDMLKAIKASNNNIALAEITFQRLKPQIIGLCVAAGMDALTAEEAWKKIRDFSDYGFNKAHATSYAWLGYVTAWLKTHHPLEFMCATLQTWAGTDKEVGYSAEARRMGIPIRRATLNESDLNWTMSKGGLRRGLLSLKGVGPRVAEKIIDARPFDSQDDVKKRAGKLVARVAEEQRAWGEIE